jgi:hypothetical protein
MTKFALLTYSTNNLGDEIQSIAARQFLPQTDFFVDRDDWTTSPSDAAAVAAKIILNGWFTHNPEKWPPPPFLSPCLISMHITRERYKPTTLTVPAVTLLQGDNLAYLKRHQPVGGRDLWTTSLLKQHGVDSYFSGCLTLALGAGGTRERRDFICAVDLPEAPYRILLGRTRTPVLRLSHRDTGGGTFEERCAKAGRLLSLYAHAKCVVTTRLHSALPCLALATPVLFINTAVDQYRLSGLVELVRSCTAEAFETHPPDFDFDRPTPNGSAHMPLRQALIARLETFAAAPMRPFCPASTAEIDSYGAIGGDA